MGSSYLIYKGDYGIVFIRTDNGCISKVSVKMESSRRAIRSYTFRNIPDNTFQSPYISWANLNCCDGWTFDKSYLLTAVQEGRKLCSGMIMYDEIVAKNYIESLSDEYLHFCSPPTHNGPQTRYHIDVTRKGSIDDYIEMESVQRTYSALELDFLDFGYIRRYASEQMIHLLDGTIPFDYANPVGSEQHVVTGLLLGYPLESTAAILTE